jgi:peptidoglycan/xylan/chitin deacetylase (PgdA/CDA1 family)
MELRELKTAKADRTLEKVKWPKGARCAVTFTFDFDAQSLFFAIKADATQITQGEFGGRVGIWRLLGLLDKYNIKTTFFVPGLTAELYPEAAKAIAEKGHELGCHGYAHEGVQNLSYNEEVELFNKISKIIENVSGHKPHGWRKSGGQLSPNTLRILVDSGFTYIATGMADDIPYQWVVKDAPRNLTVIPFDWALDDATFFFTTSSIGGGSVSSPSAVFEIWSSEFDAQYELGRYYNLTLHPFCMGRAHRLFMFEKLIQYIKSHPDVWIAPCLDIVNYWGKTYPHH